MSPGPKKSVDVSSDLYQNWSFSVNLTEKGRTTLVIKKESLVFFYLADKGRTAYVKVCNADLLSLDLADKDRTSLQVAKFWDFD